MGAKRQGTLQGVLPPGIEEIDTAAQLYVEARNVRQGKTKLETDAKVALITAMQKHDRMSYSSKGMVVNMTEENKVNVKVTTSSDPDAEPED